MLNETFTRMIGRKRAPLGGVVADSWVECVY